MLKKTSELFYLSLFIFTDLFANKNTTMIKENEDHSTSDLPFISYSICNTNMNADLENTR
jgi:hypothetical protein